MKNKLNNFFKKINNNKVFVIVIFVLLGVVFCKPVYAGLMDRVSIALGHLLVSISNWVVSISSNIFQALFPKILTVTGKLVSNVNIEAAWKVVRDLVNMCFIFFLLIASIAKLVGKENVLRAKNAYSQVIKILLAAFLINFSKLIFCAFIDLTQIFTIQFVNAFIDSLKGVSNFFNLGVGNEPAFPLGLVFFICSLCFFSFATIAVLFALIRAIALAIYVALSPLWFLSISFPIKLKNDIIEEKINKEIVNKFFTIALSGPILGFYLWFAMLFLNSDGGVMDEASNTNTSGTITSNDTDPEMQGVGNNSELQIEVVFKVIIASAVLIYTQIEAVKSAKAAGTVAGKGLMDGVVNKVSNIGMKPLNGIKGLGTGALNKAMNAAKNVKQGASNIAFSAKQGVTGAIAGTRLGIAASRARANNFAVKARAKGRADLVNNYRAELSGIDKQISEAKKSGDVVKVKELENKKAQLKLKHKNDVEEFNTANGGIGTAVTDALFGNIKGMTAGVGGAVGATKFLDNKIEKEIQKHEAMKASGTATEAELAGQNSKIIALKKERDARVAGKALANVGKYNRTINGISNNENIISKNNEEIDKNNKKYAENEAKLQENNNAILENRNKIKSRENSVMFDGNSIVRDIDKLMKANENNNGNIINNTALRDSLKAKGIDVSSYDKLKEERDNIKNENKQNNNLSKIIKAVEQINKNKTEVENLSDGDEKKGELLKENFALAKQLEKYGVKGVVKNGNINSSFDFDKLSGEIQGKLDRKEEVDKIKAEINRLELEYKKISTEQTTIERENSVMRSENKNAIKEKEKLNSSKIDLENTYSGLNETTTLDGKRKYKENYLKTAAGAIAGVAAATSVGNKIEKEKNEKHEALEKAKEKVLNSNKNSYGEVNYEKIDPFKFVNESGDIIRGKEAEFAAATKLLVEFNEKNKDSNNAKIQEIISNNNKKMHDVVAIANNNKDRELGNLISESGDVKKYNSVFEKAASMASVNGSVISFNKYSEDSKARAEDVDIAFDKIMSNIERRLADMGVTVSGDKASEKVITNIDQNAELNKNFQELIKVYKEGNKRHANMMAGSFEQTLKLASSNDKKDINNTDAKTAQKVQTYQNEAFLPSVIKHLEDINDTKTAEQLKNTDDPGVINIILKRIAKKDKNGQMGIRINKFLSNNKEYDPRKAWKGTFSNEEIEDYMQNDMYGLTPEEASEYVDTYRRDKKGADDKGDAANSGL